MNAHSYAPFPTGKIKLANSAQAKKRARQSERRHTNNTRDRSRMRSAVKKVVAAIDTGDKSAAEAAYKKATREVDRMANKGLIHKNKAGRHKRHLNAHIRAL